MNTPERIFLGWDRPAIELVAHRLLEGLRNPQTAAQYRRATVVVPTAESGRRLREYMAEKAGKALLMPRITLAGQLLTTGDSRIATEAGADYQGRCKEHFHWCGEYCGKGDKRPIDGGI